MDYVIANQATIAEASADRAAHRRTGDRGQDGPRRGRGSGRLSGGRSHNRSAPPPQLGVARRRVGEDVIKGVLLLAALLSVLTTTGIVISLLTETISFFESVGFSDFMFGTDWSPVIKPQSFGVVPLVTGTLLVTGIALLVAVPLGLGAAIYLSEYASPRVRRTLKPALELLAGVPTIVFGYFALTFFTPTVLQDFLNVKVGVFNVLSASVIMGFMVIPTIASVAEDAMSAVPQSLREGSVRPGRDAPTDTLSGVEMGLDLAKVPHRSGGVLAAMDVLKGRDVVAMPKAAVA